MFLICIFIYDKAAGRKKVETPHGAYVRAREDKVQPCTPSVKRQHILGDAET